MFSTKNLLGQSPAREAEAAAAKAAHAARETEAATAGCVGPQKPKMPGKGTFAAEAPAAAEATAAAEAPMAAPKAGESVSTVPIAELELREITSKISISERDAPHIFRNKIGHFTEDTLLNRCKIINVVSNMGNFLGQCERGSLWFAKTLEDGTQIWAEVRKGIVRDAGINKTPRFFNPSTGLKNDIRM